MKVLEVAAWGEIHVPEQLPPDAALFEFDRCNLCLKQVPCALLPSDDSACCALLCSNCLRAIAADVDIATAKDSLAVGA